MTTDELAFHAAIDAASADPLPVLIYCDWLSEVGREVEAEGVREAVGNGKMPEPPNGKMPEPPNGSSRWSGRHWNWWYDICKLPSCNIAARVYMKLSYGGMYPTCSDAWADLGRAYAKMVEERRAKDHIREGKEMVNA